MKHIIILLVIFTSLSTGFIGCQKKETEPQAATVEENKSGNSISVAEVLASMNMYHFKDPTKAPDFELISVNGQKVSLASFRGKTVLLSFWATW